jgi:hypothetical protein
MSNSLSVIRFACAILRVGTGMFVVGLGIGLTLILYFFYVTPSEICSAAFSTMTVSEAWPWLLPLLATEGLALGLAAFGVVLLASKEARQNPQQPNSREVPHDTNAAWRTVH